MTLKIDILCNDGSPLGVTLKTLYGNDPSQIGVGGAEYALLTMCEAWAKYGYDVTLYNNPRSEDDPPFKQRSLSDFVPSDNRDILIVFRSPNLVVPVCKGKKVWWSTDQYTVGDFAKFSKLVDQIVVISKFHADYFAETYNILNTTVIDLPVRVNDIIDVIMQKNPQPVQNRLIFTSVPDRGLNNLRLVWDILKRRIPDLSLVITSDYRLWGAGALNEHHRAAWMKFNDVKFLGAVNRYKLLEELLQAQVFVYPCDYDELFCVACAEAQVAGVYPVTSNKGALSTTNMGGSVLDGEINNDFLNRFIEEITNTLSDQKALKEKSRLLMKKAYDRFNVNKIVDDWNIKVFS